MKKLGISIYPEKASFEENKKYIEEASSLGFDRIFSCLLSVDTERKDEIIREFNDINTFARECGMEVIVDVNPRVFKELNIGYDDLSFFEEIGADGLRLDLGFTGREEAMMTFNPEELDIEINLSNDTHMIDTIMDYMPNPNKLIGCHNFYPHRYTGLTEDFFMSTSKKFKQYGLRTAAFISSNDSTFGPWPVTDGLPTLEIHRNLPVDVQLKYYIMLNGLIDDVIISNCFPSADELVILSSLRRDMVTFDVTFEDDIRDIEKSIVLDELHFKRGDINDYVVRSTMPRVKHKGHYFDVHNTKDIKRGDIIIESSEYGHYAGELQIALQDMPNSGKTNVVGRIREEEIFLLDYLKPWQKFKLQISKK
jgi:hypothetical protein